ncbi:gliding motility-associated C-terminal domain-containing protein [Emticicia fontis]
MKYFTIISMLCLKTYHAFSQCTQKYSWASWSNFSGNSATGTILVDGKTVKVTMSANYTFTFTSVIYGFTEFSRFAGYSFIPNSTTPRTNWAAGTGGKTTMCFSEPVTNPVLLISSLGGILNNTKVILSFSDPYSTLYDGGGMTYLSNTSISGYEGYAILLFPGTFTCLTIYSNTPEEYTNINWGLQPPIFPVTISGDTKGCEQVTLTASGGVKYDWNGGKNPTSATNTFEKSGAYTVTATDRNGCKSIALKSIKIGYKTTMSEDKTICKGESYQGHQTTGKYTDTWKTPEGCDSIRVVNLTVTQLPQVKLTTNKQMCLQEPVDIYSQLTPNNVSVNYKWSTGEFTPNISVQKPGNYKLIIENGTCSTSTSITVVSIKPPAIKPDEIVCLNSSSLVLQSGTVDSGLKYHWTPNNSDNSTLTVNQTGTYKITATSVEGCSASRTITVLEACNEEIFAPDIFTPNNDNINDTFKVFITNAKLLSLDIYNRWGNIIYSDTSTDPQWNGKYIGEKCPTGLYVYILKYQNIITNKISEYTGTILLQNN